MIANIVNASTRTVPQSVAPMPVMRSTIMGWFRPLELTKVIKSTVDFQTVEVEVPVPAQGTIQQLSMQSLAIKPEGTRTWDWRQIHATPDLELLTDDVIKYQGKPYRVMAKNDYAEQGFVEYHVVSDYHVRHLASNV